MSTRTVQRIWAEAGLQPHRTETFKFSTDPAFEAKVRDSAVSLLEVGLPECI
jgi:hypothetical protein